MRILDWKTGREAERGLVMSEPYSEGRKRGT